MSLTLALSIAACVKESPEQPLSGSATLRWSPVITDSNGKTLKNLAGYRIHYGTSAKGLYTVVVVKNPKQTTYIVRDLYPGTWYFAVGAYTTNGVEGPLSNVASKTVK
jgi:Fibronectin type III domain